jgi:hypothetical protein
MTTDTPRTPEELLESMTGMFLPPSAMGEVNGLKVLCLQRENAALKAEVARLKELVKYAVWALKSYNSKYAEEIEAILNFTDK